jgi:hypothetical protein
MIGVLYDEADAEAVSEFFQLFKTPWEPYCAEQSYDVVVCSKDPGSDVKAQLLIIFGSNSYSTDLSPTRDIPGRRMSFALLEDTELPLYGKLVAFENTDADKACAFAGGEIVGHRGESNKRTTLRLGYDLFKEVDHLLTRGQPLENARIPTLDLHIELLRRWILEAGISFVEVPPAPAGARFIVCLTHDIDFVGIRNHRFDHTMFGFLFRATFGALLRFLRGRIALRYLLRSWAAAASLPLVYLGWREDFWLPFEWYLRVEKELGATYYLIPFKDRGGDKLPANVSALRATAYELSDLSEWIKRLQDAGCEIGVHGIDAWHDSKRAVEEREKVVSVSGAQNLGVRMHWLLSDEKTTQILDEAGYAYDSTAGYNHDVGYYAGTSQVYRPAHTRHLLELPLHIQDGALFYPQRLDLSDADAMELCNAFVQRALSYRGVLTILWHDRSHGPERFWGAFYVRLLAMLKESKPWFATARETVGWFAARRSIIFERHTSALGESEVVARCGEAPSRAFRVRTHQGAREIEWTGTETINLSDLLRPQGGDNPAKTVPKIHSGASVNENLHEALPTVG